MCLPITDCHRCLGHGRVCSAHPELAWGPGLPSGYYPVERVCWCGVGPRPCPGAAPQCRCPPLDEAELDSEPPRRSDLPNMLLWALAAAAITVVFGIVLNVLEAVL